MSFSWPLKITRHCHIRGFRLFACTGENPKWQLLFQKPRKGLLLSVIHKSCVQLKNTFYSVFSTHAFAEIQECELKTETYQKLGLCVYMQKCLLVFYCWCSCFFVTFFFEGTSPLKGYSPAILEVCPFFVPPKALSFKPYFFPFFGFLLSLLSSLSKIPSFLFFVHQQLFGTYFWGCVLCFFLLLS